MIPARLCQLGEINNTGSSQIKCCVIAFLMHLYLIQKLKINHSDYKIWSPNYKYFEDHEKLFLWSYLLHQLTNRFDAEQHYPCQKVTCICKKMPTDDYVIFFSNADHVFFIDQKSHRSFCAEYSKEQSSQVSILSV